MGAYNKIRAGDGKRRTIRLSISQVYTSPRFHAGSVGLKVVGVSVVGVG